MTAVIGELISHSEQAVIQIQEKYHYPILRKKTGFQNPMQQMQTTRSHDSKPRNYFSGFFILNEIRVIDTGTNFLHKLRNG